MMVIRAEERGLIERLKPAPSREGGGGREDEEGRRRRRCGGVGGGIGEEKKEGKVEKQEKGVLYRCHGWRCCQGDGRCES